MKILFICGCAEPGKDGVGDYTRLLSQSVIQKGNKVVIVALNDLCTDTFKEIQIQNDLNLIRIPSVFSAEEKVSRTRSLIETFKPDWISLQFVPYAFNKRGMPFDLLKQLEKIKGKEKWHVMIHEPWLGISVESPLKHKMYGLVQRWIIKEMIRILMPLRISTSNFLYQTVLKSKGINADIIPLFSNIPVCETDESFKAKVYKQIGIEAEKRHEWKLIGIFGNIYPSSLLESALNKEIQSTPASLRLAFIGIGSMSDWAKNEFSRLSGIFKDKVKFVHFGILSESEVSTMLQMWDIGIACTPMDHIAKSGSYAAMRLHGLKTVITDGKVIPEFNIDRHNEFVERKPEQWSVEQVSELFLESLASAEPVNNVKTNMNL